MLYKCAPTVHACIDIGDAQYWITDNLILVRFDIEVSSLCNERVYHPNYRQKELCKTLYFARLDSVLFGQMGCHMFFGYLRLLQVGKPNNVQRPWTAS